MSQFTKLCWLIGSLVDWLIAMKIGINGLFLNRPTTGTGQYLLELLPELVQRDTQNEYVLFTKDESGKMKD